MEHFREDRTPNLLLMRYALATWEVRDLLLIPSFMFSESAVIKRPVHRSLWRRRKAALIHGPPCPPSTVLATEDGPAGLVAT
ncbi:MAG: DpnI domain-containing protein [Limisphaerales bacterium]